MLGEVCFVVNCSSPAFLCVFAALREIFLRLAWAGPFLKNRRKRPQIEALHQGEIKQKKEN
jgi:hypothetical protein